MSRTRFIGTWLTAAILMYGISYAWHGMILNDFTNLTLPLPVFLGLLALVYLLIGFIITFVSSLRGKQTNPTFSGLLTGVSLGFFIYLIAFTLGVSFKSADTKHIILDFGWQMFEQGLGGVVVARLFAAFRKRDEFFEVEA